VTISPPPTHAIDAVLRRAVEEDLGDAGDLTTTAIFDSSHHSRGEIVARAEGTIAGLSIGARVFDLLDGDTSVTFHVADGDSVASGTVLATVEGSTQAILAGERICLNLLGHLSGIATATRAVVDAIGDAHTRVADTRKTTPGLRSLEKYAVRCGGGINHRFGLYDTAMIKDNHIAAAGSVAAAVDAVRRRVGHTVSVVVEVDRLDQIDAAVAGGADVILLDNLRGDALREAVARVDGRARTEASGGITPSNVAAIALSGIDVVSLGWITHSAPRLDVALDL
jgi:nicotinate-nucleotide pyrophosphorylase (carboxylating)